MRLTHALSTCALTPLALGLLTLGVPSSATAATVQPDPDALRLVQRGGGQYLGEDPLAQVSTGYWQAVGLTLDGKVVVGGESNGATVVPASLDSEEVVQVASGYRHALALDADGDVTAWGRLGDRSGSVEAPAAFVPQEVQDADLAQVSAGYAQDLGVTTTGDLLVWGAPQPGYDLSAVPAEVADLEVASAYADFSSAAILSTDGTVVSWGWVGPAPASLADETVVAVSVGRSSALAHTADGDLVAWGSSESINAIPQAVVDGDVTAFDVGDYGAMAATADGTIYSWGAFDRDITPPSTSQPVQDLQVERYNATAVYAALVAEVAPEITNDARVDSPLSVTPGTWSTTPETVHYQWYRSGEPVGTDAATYTPTADDLGDYVWVTVRVGAGSATGTVTTPSLQVSPAAFTTAPRVTVAGAARVGKVLTMRATAATPAADASRRVWLRDGTPIAGATGASYRPVAADLGHRVTAAVSVARDGYAPATAVSTPVRIAPGAASVRVRTPARVARGATMRLRAAALAPRETYTVTLAGKLLARGRTDAAGRVDRAVRIPRAVGAGRRTLVVTGSYADRTGRRTVTVTR